MSVDRMRREAVEKLQRMGYEWSLLGGWEKRTVDPVQAAMNQIAAGVGGGLGSPPPSSLGQVKTCTTSPVDRLVRALSEIRQAQFDAASKAGVAHIILRGSRSGDQLGLVTMAHNKGLSTTPNSTRAVSPGWMFDLHSTAFHAETA